MSGIITLTSDWGNKDFYAAAFKGRLLSLYPQCKIVDVTHQVSLSNISHAAYQIGNVFSFFPEKTIHIVAVNYINSMDIITYQEWMLPKNKDKEKDFYFTDIVAFSFKNHYFMCQNNGLVSLLCPNDIEIEEIVQLMPSTESKHLSFSALDYYPQAIVQLLQGKKLSQIGKPYEKEKIMRHLNNDAFVGKNQPDNVIRFFIKYIDGYGNWITNLKKETFLQVAKGRKRFIFYNPIDGEEILTYISKNYEDCRNSAGIFFIFGISQYLEIGRRDMAIADYYMRYTRNFKEIQFTIRFED